MPKKEKARPTDIDYYLEKAKNHMLLAVRSRDKGDMREADWNLKIVNLAFQEACLCLRQDKTFLMKGEEEKKRYIKEILKIHDDIVKLLLK